MVIFLLSFSPPSGASKVASPLFASKAFLDLARLTVPLFFLSWSLLSFSFLRCSPLNLIFLWLQPLKPLVTSCAMLLKFRANQYFMAQRLTISEPWGFGSWQANMVEFENTLRLERAELDSCEETRKANRQYRTSHGTYRIKRTQ